jgi:RNA 3'-terminal phosphate cyclase-like protein
MELEGSCLFRHHLVCSILAKKPIVLRKIHSDDDPQGIQAPEANFLKFIDRVTNGSKMEVRQGKSELHFVPGMILGGSFEHDVPSSRCVTYVAEAALLLLPFAKYDSKIILVGSTQSDLDLSADTLRTVTCRWLQLFGVAASVRVIRRGCAPSGGGAIELSVAAVRRLKSVKITDRGSVKRVRGISFACRTAPDLPQRVATSSKGVLLNFLPDVYVVTDVDDAKGRKGESCSGYGVTLVAETTSKVSMLSQETSAAPRESPEAVGERAAKLLLDQILEGGCVDGHHQLMVLLLMALAPDEVSMVRLGRITSSAVSAMSLMETFFGVTCAVKEEASPIDPQMPPSTLITCIGSAAVNVWKKSN